MRLASLFAFHQRQNAFQTQRKLWKEYRDETLARGEAAYSCSQFCARLKARLKCDGGKTQMRIDYTPGPWGLSDFSGKTLGLRTGRGDKDVEIFVAVLAHSDMTYPEAMRDIREPDYGDILLGRARRVGPSAIAWAERCFASRDFPEEAFATVRGMIRLADDHGAERLDALCAEAFDLNCLASGFLRERIKHGGPEPAARASPRDHPRPQQHPRRHLPRQRRSDTMPLRYAHLADRDIEASAEGIGAVMAQVMAAGTGVGAQSFARQKASADRNPARQTIGRTKQLQPSPHRKL